MYTENYITQEIKMTEKPRLTINGFSEKPKASLRERFLAGRARPITSDLGRSSAVGTRLRAPNFEQSGTETDRLSKIQTMLASKEASIEIDSRDPTDPEVLLHEGEEKIEISDLLSEGARIRRKRLKEDGGDVLYTSRGLKKVEHGSNKGQYRLSVQNEGGGQTSMDPSELVGPPNKRDAEAGRAWRLELS